MAQIPTPRSYSEILGDMIDAFLSRYGLRALKIGSPVLSMLESAAQSDLRSSEDIFTLLEAVSLDQAKGVALDRIGADESVPRDTENPASGTVTIGDSSFTKISSKIFQGTAAPIVGAVNINVTDATSFPSSGSIYIGRGTNNYEGPLAYTSKLPPGVGGGFSGGNYWTLVLSSGTLRFHNLGESVILAQGGNRDIPAGQICQTPQGNVVAGVQFKTLYGSRIPDGETEITGVIVVALKPGTLGNVAADAISSFESPPFAGATITNPGPFTNGLASESDDSYRERIREARQSRTKGTPLALQTFATGVTSTDENKRVLSASVVSRQGTPSVLYIDDGTGYEESAEGVAIESFIDLATGGEDYFKVSSLRPVTKAYVLTEEVAPYTLSAGQQLAFSVGGVTTVHTFDADEFRSIGNATAYEVVASINSNFDLNWAARTNSAGTKVAVFAKSDTNESIQNIVIDDVDGEIVDANVYLGFSAGRVDTMRLYKNDRLLTKDGNIASVVAAPFATWATMGATETLQLQVDNTPMDNLVGGAFTFTAQDFINAETGYTSVGRNSPEAWAAVFNYRVPGITATVVNGLITLTSNRGYSSKASLKILGGTLVNHGMFALTPEAIVGADSDYKLDRNTGELRLTVPLDENDRLAAGSVYTRAFLESPALSTVNVTIADAKMWFSGDGRATIVEHGLSASNPMTFSSTAEAWGVRQRMAGTSGTFTNVQVGDWLVFWDPTTPAAILNKVYRVAAVNTTTYAWVEFDLPSAVAPAVYTFANGGVTIVRTTGQLQNVTIPIDNNYTAAGVYELINAQLVGIEAEVYRTTALRIKTETFSDVNGDLALVAANSQARLFQLPEGDYTPNLTGHLASVESGHPETGTPDFHVTTVNATVSGTNPTVTWSADPVYSAPEADDLIVGLRSPSDGTTLLLSRYGNERGHVSPIADVTAGPVLEDRIKPLSRFQASRLWLASPYRLASDDLLTILADGDTEQKRFVVPMWRTLSTVGTTYAGTNTFVDGDNGDQSLAVGFGYTGGPTDPFDFNDFAVYMAARVKTHDQGSSFTSIDAGVYDIDYNPVEAEPNLNRTVLWRYYRLGPDGNQARIKYALPAAEDLPVAVSVDSFSGLNTDISVVLKSGNLCAGYTLADSYPVGTVAVSTTAGLTKVWYILAYKVTSLSRTAGTVSFTLNLPAGVINTGLNIVGAVPYYFVSNTGSLATQDVLLNGQVLSGGQNKIVTSAIAGADFGPIADAGVLYLAASTTATLAGATPAVAQGDFFRVDSNASIDAFFENQTVRIQNDVVANPYMIEAVMENFAGVVAGSPTVTYAPVGDASAFKIFKNPAETAATIVAAINALVTADARIPVRPTLIGAGSQKIDRSSAEDAAASPTWYNLTDGINYVKTTTPPGSLVGDYQLLFKNDITAALATNSDWANEVVRIVPRTAKNVVDWLNAPAVSGLFTACEVVRSSAGRKVQLASLTPGSVGSVQVQGGTANSATAAVLGSATLANNQLVVTVPAIDVAGMQALCWAAVDNTEVLPKSVFSGATVLNTIVNNTATTSVLTFAGGTNVYTLRGSASASCIVQVEKQGDFVAITDTGFGTALSMGSVLEGDWIRIAAPATVTYVGGGSYTAVQTIDTGNRGVFRVVRRVGNTVWIENAAAVEQAQAEADFKFFTPDSIIPGDTLVISTSLWDGAASNQGSYEIVDVGNAGAGSYLNQQKLTVRATMSTVGSPATALGAQLQQVQVLEAAPARYIKQIVSIAPNQLDGDLADIKFATNLGSGRIGSTPGSIVSLLDKLDFPTTISKGVDGYQHSTGLIAEVNKVIYGDPADPSTYPGVAAAGATVNISGPLVKRVQVTLSLRLRTGATRSDIEGRVKSAVASVINRAGIGEAIALSDLTKAAGRVGGVVSATMVSPLATAGNDLISVQPYEKPLVLNVDTDVLISFAGE